jgi:aryl-alcohol dehydrogenase-like predicted oxidoreductase
VERRRLGESGATVGAVGLGTATWARGTDPAEARDHVRMLVDAGGSLVDLGGDMPDTSFAASVFSDAGLRRASFVALRLRATSSGGEMLARLDDALESTGIGHADLWTIEGWEAAAPWHEIATALAVAVATGRARYVGMCPTAAWQPALVGAGLAMHPDRAGLAAITTAYSLLDHAATASTAEVAAALGAGILASWPLAGGVLTGKYRHATPPDSRGAGERHAARLHRYRSDWARPVVDGLCAAAEGLGTTPGAVALAWVRARPGVSAALVGARTVHQWRATLASADLVLPPELTQALDEVAAGAAAVGHDGESGSRIA